MNGCRHRFEPFYTAPFQVVQGAAWAIEFCKCGEPQWHVVNPNGNSAITEDQPLLT